MIYIGTTKDLMEEYSKRSQNEIDHSNFVIISSRVRTTRTRDNVILASNIFLNAGILRGTNFMDDPEDPETVRHFKSYILKIQKKLVYFEIKVGTLSVGCELI